MIREEQFEEKYYYLAFSHFQKIGPTGMRRLEERFSSIREAYYSSATSLERAGIKASTADEFIRWRNAPVASIANMVSVLKQENIYFLIWHDACYPQLLKEISDPPPVIYYKGAICGAPENRLSVVGSRKFSAYGEKVISELLPALVNTKIEIVSGLAIGIDTLAHQQTLKNHGRTIAVLGSGLDYQSLYPRCNRQLAEQIINNGGALISEFPPGTPPLKQNFPQRNRLISGLCQGTLVIESKNRSGSLITANYALEQNREVLAIPGNIFSEYSAGPNMLIKAGAKSVTGHQDVLELYGIDTDTKSGNAGTKQPSLFSYNSTEALVQNLLSRASERGEILDTDDIIHLSGLDSSLINSTLSMLELQGIVKTSETGYELI